MHKRYTAVILLLILISGLFGCEIQEDTAADTPSVTPIETAGSPVPQTEDNIAQPNPMALKTLTVDEVLELACEKLDIDPSNITYENTDPVTGDYIFSFFSDTFYVDPVSGDLKKDNTDLGKIHIINLLGHVTEPTLQEPDNKSIEDIVIENIKNRRFDDAEVQYSVKKKAPYFVSDYDTNRSGLIIDNEYINLNEFGISDDDINDYAVSGLQNVYTVDVDNDGIDELCSDFIAGTGLFPYTLIFRLDKTTNKYTKMSLLEPFYNEMNYMWVEFFRINDTVYTVIFFGTEYRVYKITNDQIIKVSKITVTYPSYDITASSDDGILQALQKKYTKQLPYIYPKTVLDYVLTPLDNVCDKMDETDIEDYSNKSYTLVDLDNDGSDELFFQWAPSSQTRLGSTVFLNLYSVFKLQNGRYELYDTNKDSYFDESISKTFPMIPDGSEYPLNVFFEEIDGKTYMIIVDKGYDTDANFEEGTFDELTIYLIEKEFHKEIGTIRIIYKPEIVVDR